METMQVGTALLVGVSTEAGAELVRQQPGFIPVEFYSITPLPGEIGTLENARFVLTAPVKATPLVARTIDTLLGFPCD